VGENRYGERTGWFGKEMKSSRIVLKTLPEDGMASWGNTEPNLRFIEEEKDPIRLDES